MQSAPRVTVLSATFEALAGLKATVASLDQQSFRGFEHVVVDGGSSDGTPAWLETQGERIRWVSEPDRGIADALNKGLALARGDYILVLHAEDTLIDSESLRRAADGLDGSDIVGCDVSFTTARSQKRLKSRGFVPKMMFKTTIPHQGAFCRRDLFTRIGHFDPNFKIALDYEFFLRAWRSGARFRHCRLVVARMPDTGLSSRLNWNDLVERFAEERRAHHLHCPGPAMRAVYAVYWPAYLAYRRAREVCRRSFRPS